MYTFKQNLVEQWACWQQTSEITGKHGTATEDDETWIDRGPKSNGREKLKHPRNENIQKESVEGRLVTVSKTILDMEDRNRNEEQIIIN